MALSLISEAPQAPQYMDMKKSRAKHKMKGAAPVYTAKNESRADLPPLL
jgi:hypothetical protein